MNILSCFFKDIKTLNMKKDIINKLETVVLKMNDQHDRLERLLFEVKLNLVVFNDIKIEHDIPVKTISFNKEHI